MQPNNNIQLIIILVLLLIGTNLKPILLFQEWLSFKINITYKQYKNERQNKTHHRS